MDAGVARVVTDAFPRGDPATSRRLLERADIRTFRAGQTVVGQGEETRTMLVLDGHVGFRRTASDGRELIPRVVSTGQLASLMPIAGRPSVVEIVALLPCRVAIWSGMELQALAAEDAGFALDLLEHVLSTLEAVVERLDGLRHQDAVRRVAQVLELHAGILFGDEACVSRAYLPALVGTSHEMTGRVLRCLEADGVVRRIGRERLRLLDPSRLAMIAAPGHDGRGATAGYHPRVRP